MKVVSKLFYINVNYGSKLGTFLGSIGDLFKTINDPDSSIKNVYNAKDYRGKLTLKRSPIDFVASFIDKLTFYLASWLLNMVNRFITQNRFKVKKWYLYVLYFAPKVHLIIFNLVFIDFFWVITRTLLHSRGLS